MLRAASLFVGLSLLSAGLAHADDTTEPAHDDEDAHVHPQRFDYSRFSDGPRRVPVPRGASLRRAEALGLGTREAARTLLTRGPTDRWTSAASGSVPAALVWPVEGGRYGRGYGYVRRERRDLRHNGIDVVAPEGTAVRAVADGIVAYSDNGIRGFGNCVLIVHPNGWVSVYAHQSRTTVQPGWRVTAGERIGFVGSTGISRGPHLHFELRAEGRPIDPARYFRASGGDRPRLSASTRGASTRENDSGEVGEAGEVGSEMLARHLLRHAADAALVDGAAERVFSNLLWPVRGGTRLTSRRHRVTIDAEPGSAVRAAADGLVIYAGPLRRFGTAVVLLHGNGWVTVYGEVDEVAVEPRQRIRRGEWIARSRDRLSFALRDAGVATDPTDLFVQMPDHLAR